MAIIRKTKEEKQESKKPRAWSCVLRKVPVKLFVDNNYALVQINAESAKILEEAPVDVELRDDVALFTLSKFLRVEICGEEADLDNASGSGWANVKIKHSEYDYKYKGKKGHTSKLELVGINFLTYSPFDFDDDLVGDGDDDLSDLPLDLPF